MKIRSIRLARFPVRFKYAFKHASAERRHAENVIVRLESDSGLVGYGEGCPRDYVTGETVESAVKFAQTHVPSIIEHVSSLSALKSWVAGNEPAIDQNPAAFCAIELAILDLLGKDAGVPIEQLLGLTPVGGVFRYTAVLGDSKPLVYRLQFLRYRLAGFSDFKVKLSGDPARDRRKLALLNKNRRAPFRVRLDANNLWQSASSCIPYLESLGQPFFAIEEPVTANKFDELTKIAEGVGTRVILDESFLRGDQLARIPSNGDRWLINCRVSKFGGLLRSLAIAEKAKKRNFGLIVGAHVGETSILTRAGLALAHAVGDGLVAQEGAFGLHFLKADLTQLSLMFGRKGVLRMRDDLGASRPGFGLDIDEGRLIDLIAG